ncbi:MAG TPA: hypothetical protein VGI86_19805 [Acidimicrobiia bacterium]|jgi:hypothetical protein
MTHGITTTDQMFSVRAMPWHGLGVVLDEYPRSINEALQARTTYKVPPTGRVLQSPREPKDPI